jgi:hypothetical protein
MRMLANVMTRHVGTLLTGSRDPSLRSVISAADHAASFGMTKLRACVNAKLKPRPPDPLENVAAVPFAAAEQFPPLYSRTEKHALANERSE